MKKCQRNMNYSKDKTNKGTSQNTGFLLTNKISAA